MGGKGGEAGKRLLGGWTPPLGMGSTATVDAPKPRRGYDVHEADGGAAADPLRQELAVALRPEAFFLGPGEGGGSATHPPLGMGSSGGLWGSIMGPKFFS